MVTSSRPFFISRHVASVVGSLAVVVSTALLVAVPVTASATQESHLNYGTVKWLPRATSTISSRAVHQTFVVDNSYDPSLDSSGCAPHHSAGTCTLRDAINAAENDGNHFDAVTVPSGRHLVLNGTLYLTSSMEINASGAYLNASGYQAFYVADNPTVTINGLTESNGQALDGGALQCVSGSVMLANVHFNSNYASSAGGAIYQTVSCNLWIDESSFADNSADSEGGAIYLLGSADITRTTVGGNSASSANSAQYGAGIYNSDGAVQLDSDTIKHNRGIGSGYSYGVGVYNDELMSINNSAISFNTMSDSGDGAGIENAYNLTLTNSFVNSNSITGPSTSDGAGIYSGDYVMNMSNVTLSGNSIHLSAGDVNGASLYTDGGTLNWTGGSITSSVAHNIGGNVYGGAVEVGGSTEHVNFSNITVSSTNASAGTSYVSGGAFDLYSPGSMSNVHISSTTVSGSSIDGGAIYSDSDWTYGALSVSGTNDHASSPAGSSVDGGVLYFDDYSVISGANITNTTVQADLGSVTGSTVDTYVEGGVIYSSAQSIYSNLDVSGVSVSAKGGYGTVYGGVIDNDDLATYTNSQVLNATINADYDTFGGLIYTQDHFEATNFTLGDSTINVNVHHTSSYTPRGSGTILGSSATNAGQDMYSFVNGTFANIASNVTNGSWNRASDLYGHTQFTNSTFANVSMAGTSGNTEVIFVEPGAITSFHNSIVASSKPWLNCVSQGQLATQGYNIDNGSSCGFNAVGDQTNSSPKLKALANNGGPIWTAAFTVPGSSALNRASNVACPSTDARGIARPQGGTCDVGAYEYVKAKK
jgi:hypothetical protein